MKIWLIAFAIQPVFVVLGVNFQAGFRDVPDESSKVPDRTAKVLDEEEKVPDENKKVLD
ncbi:MAG TPA: hypothetical protein VK947_10675 [Planococcus sp. (in: firmicutes)]|nr:hypothetical protein [Planococcus sp. (in: firmicutes)]